MKMKIKLEKEGNREQNQRTSSVCKFVKKFQPESSICRNFRPPKFTLSFVFYQILFIFIYLFVLL